MTAVNKSSYVVDAHQQHDGSRYCKETHVLDDGRSVMRLYKLTDGINPDAQLVAGATAIDTDLSFIEQERTETAEAIEVLSTIVETAVRTGIMTSEQAARLGVRETQRAQVQRG